MQSASFAVAAIALMLIAQSALGEMLGLNMTDPDISATGVSITYEDGALGVSGKPDLFNSSVPFLHTNADYFSITAHIDASGVLEPGTGAILVTGDIPGIPGASGTLLSGTLTRFGFLEDLGPPVFEFEFDVTGGALKDAYGKIGGAIVTGDALSGPLGPYLGNFQSNFSTMTNGIANVQGVVPVPLPNALPGGLALFAIAGTFYIRRRKQLAV